jgi:hypothetical protein
VRGNYIQPYLCIPTGIADVQNFVVCVCFPGGDMLVKGYAVSLENVHFPRIKEVQAFHVGIAPVVLNRCVCVALE